MFPQGETVNPSLAAKALLGFRGTVRRVGSVYKGSLAGRHLRAFRRRRTTNPALAALGSVAGLAGGKLGRRVDPGKHQIRAAHITNLANSARLGDEASLLELQRIASGVAWPGAWSDLAATAAQHYDLIAAIFEKKASKAEAIAAARAGREARFLEAGTSIAGSAAQALLSRGRRLPRRRKRRRQSYY